MQEDGLLKVGFWKKSWAGGLNRSPFLFSDTGTKSHQQKATGAEQGKGFFLQAHNLFFFLVPPPPPPTSVALLVLA